MIAPDGGARGRGPWDPFGESRAARQGDNHPLSTGSPADSPAILIDVRVVPRAGKSGVAGTRGGALLVRLQAPPVDGAANEELVNVLAKALGIPRRAVEIVAGGRSRTKRVRVVGVTAMQVAALFEPKPVGRRRSRGE